MALLGLDVGSTGCKAIVFDDKGDILGEGFREYAIETDRTGKAEQDAEAIWKITEEVLKQAVAASGRVGIKALAVSVQGDSSIPVDRNWTALAPAILGMDYRPAGVAEKLADKLGDFLLFERTGMRPHPINAAVKTAWLRENNPEVYERSWKIVTYADFILGKLGSEPVIDLTMASRTGVFDLKSREWSEELIRGFGLDRDKFSQALPSGTVAGRIDPGVAERIGLDPGTLLVTGGHDQTCAGIGAGLVTEGSALLSTGTAEVLSTAFHAPKLTDTMYEAYYPCYIHAKPDLFFTFSLNHVGGLLLRWYRDNLALQGESFDSIVSGLPDRPSGVMVLPHFNGSGTPWCDMDSKGAFVGLTMATTRKDIVLGILESQTYELKINVEAMKKAGISVSNIVAAGGGAKSPLWLQIRSDVLGCPVRTLRVREAACLGAAILAGSASGVYSSIDEGVANTVQVEKEFVPDPAMVEKYAEKLETYSELYPALQRINHRLGADGR